MIKIDKLEIYAYHGVLEEEKKEGQFFYVDAALDVDTRRAGMTDNLNETVNYAEVCELIAHVMTEEKYDLIETCAEKIAEAILLGYPAISGVEITINKPSAPIPMNFGNVSVSISRKRHSAFIALGSNMGDSEELITEAVRKLDADQLCKVKKQASLVRTKAYGVTDQPDFVNGMLEIETVMTAHELLDRLHEIEAEAGRERVLRWGPRTLDLDIILFDDEIISDDDLCVPHIDMKNRDFVLRPLAEIAPYKVHPVYGKRVAEMLEELEASAGGGDIPGCVKSELPISLL